MNFEADIRRLAERSPDALLAWWRERLDPPSPRLRLPSDRPRTSAGRVGGVVRRVLEGSHLRALERLRRDHEISDFMIALAIWALLLSRRTGEEDVTIGAPFVDRVSKSPRFPDFFANTLALRFDLSRPKTPAELFDQVRGVVLDGWAHRDVSFERLAPESTTERGDEGPPIFQTTLSYVQDESDEVREAVVREALDVRSLPAPMLFEPSLTWTERAGEIVVEIDYAAEVFDQSTILRLCGSFLTLLTAIAEDPSASLGALSDLTPGQRHQLLIEWNDTDRPTPRLRSASWGEPPSSPRTSGEAVTFLDLFLARVEEQGDAVAIVDLDDGDDSAGRVAHLSYGELLRRARRRAAALGDLGGERKIGVAAERSPEVIVEAIAIFLAGGVYVPLDPDYPPARLEQMRRDAEIEDSSIVSSRGADRADALRGVFPQSAAYVLYTSGSTGQPKGVVISHASLGWYCRACGEHYALTPNDRVLQLASISFDISVGEIFPALASGSTLVLRDSLTASSIPHFLRRCRDHRISVLLPPTAFWHELAAQLDLETFPSTLRLTSFGGEAVHPERIAAWREHAPPRVRLVNGYGPTETTVEAAIQELISPAGRVSTTETEARIGRPVSGVRLYLLDAEARLVALGAAGELCVGGPGLARGYHRRPAATAERFIPDPFAARPGLRVYRTGDRARLLADGSFELLGRADGQIKIRGVRIEIAEVETVLRTHEDVREAVVVAPKIADERRMTAFLVAEQEQDWAAWLRERLPTPLIPQRWIRLGRLPKSAVGKIDRGALEQRASEKIGHEAPRAGVGSRVARIVELFRELLQQETIDPDDDFFALGGHSLLVVRLLARLREQGFELTPADFFSAPTAAQAAWRMRRQVSEIRPRKDRPTAPTAPWDAGVALPQQRWMRILDRWRPDRSGDHPIEWLRLRGVVDEQRLKQALQRTATRHEALRTLFVERDGELRQIVHPPTSAVIGGLVSIDLRRLNPERREPEARRRLTGWMRRGFDLKRGPLRRLALVRCDEEEFLFFRAVHHIATDGISETLLQREREAFLRGEDLPLPVLQPADLIERQTLRPSDEKALLAWWREAFADAPPPLLWPTDHPRTKEANRRTGAVVRALPSDRSETLKSICRRSEATPFMFWTACFSLFLQRLCDRRDVVLGTPASVRTPEMETVVGCWINTLPIRLQVDDSLTGRDWLTRVRRTVLDALTHNRLPFDRLTKEIAAERDEHNPLFQVMLELRPKREAIRWPGADVEPLALEIQETDFEPSLGVWPEDDGWRVELTYAEGLWDASSTARLLDRFVALTCAVLDEPNHALAGLSPWDGAAIAQMTTEQDVRPLSQRDDRSLRASAVQIRRVLEPIWTSVLQLDPERPQSSRSFFALGGDSILGLRLLGRAARQGRRIAPRELFEHPSLEALCLYLAAREQTAASDETIRRGPLPLTPIQRQFFTWRDEDDLDEYVQSQWLRLAAAPAAIRWRSAVAALIAAHDALRLRFERRGDEWMQICDGPPVDRAAPALSVDLSLLRTADRERVQRRAVARLHRACEPLRGASAVFAAFDLGRDARILAVVHHLAVDAVSWPILLEDLDSALRQARRGEHPRIETTGMPFTAWASLTASAEQAIETQGAAAAAGDFGTIASERTRTIELDLPRIDEGLRIDEILLTATARALAGWSGRLRSVFEIEGHGRGGPRAAELTRTVGWLTALQTIEVDLRTARSDGETLAAVRDALSGDPVSTSAEILFNYLGDLDATAPEAAWTPADDAIGRDLESFRQGSRGVRTHRFEINAGLRDGRLLAEWAWSESHHGLDEIERLLTSLRAEWTRLVGHLENPSREDVLPPTPMQPGLLVEVLAAPGSGVYVEQSWWTLPESLDLDRLRIAWQTLLDRHAALRARFDPRDERPRQRIVGRVRGRWSRIDLRGLDDAGYERAFQALQGADRRRGFDPAQAPLMRWIVAEGMSERRLLWSMSHLILDGWSTPLLLEELEALLADRELPPPPSWKEIVRRKVDFDRREAERFWREELKGFTEPTPLPESHSESRSETRSKAEPPRGVGEVSSRRMTLDLARIAGGYDVTPATLLQAAWGILLSRLSGREEAMFGLVVSGRSETAVEAERWIGLLANTVPLRVRLPRGESTETWLGELQKRSWEAQRHSGASLLDVRAWSEIPRPRPLFESLLIIENFPDRGLGVLPEPQSRGQADSALALYATPSESSGPSSSSLELSLEYDRVRFTKTSALRILRRFEATLEAISRGRPEDLERAERHLLLYEMRSVQESSLPRRRGPEDAGEAIVRRLAQDGDAVALVVRGERPIVWTRGGLLRRIEERAWRLHDAGVGRIGLRGERGVETVIEMVAALRAGVAWVPLDPSFPEKRLEKTAQHSRVAEGAAPATFEGNDCEAALAYVIYTSGSTGEPKGVAVPRSALNHFLDSMARRPGLAAADVFLATTTVGFDISILEILLPLRAGARLVLADRAIAEDPFRLGRVFEEERTTIAQATPSGWRQRLDAGWTPPAYARILSGGEALPAALARELAANGAEVWNLYGPTETTVWSTLRRVRGSSAARVDIGHPIHRTVVRVFDARLRPSPIGAPGELYLGGAGSARGYLEDPARTAERFVPDPFGPAGARLYRTGDLVRRRDDGSFDFLGRFDHQVKVRGFRVELDEIPAVLQRRRDVREAAAALRGEAIAVWFAADESAENLRLWLAEQVPGYLVPSIWTAVEELPRLPNGKIDRGSLPEPARPAAAKSSSPETPMERLVAAVWEDVLDLEDIAPDDDFFALGGHSLHGTRILTRLRESFGEQSFIVGEVRLQDVFEHPTIASSAAFLTEVLRAGSSSTDKPRSASLRRSDEKPLSFAQERMWLLERLFPGTRRHHLASARRRPGLDLKVFQDAVRDLCFRHPALRTFFPQSEESARLIVAKDPIEVRILDVDDLSTEGVDPHLRRFYEESFDLERGPLFRAAVLRCGGRTAVFFAWHHMIFDGASFEIFERDLAELESAYREDRAPRLPELPLEPTDFAVWQRAPETAAVYGRRLELLRRELEGDDPAELPLDRPRPPHRSGTARTVERRIDEGRIGLLRRRCAELGATPQMLLLAAWSVALGRGRDFRVGIPIDHRNRRELEEMIGCFINTSALSIRPGESVAETVRETRRIVLNAYAHQDLPFEALVDALQPERDLSRTPLFQVFFAFRQSSRPGTFEAVDEFEGERLETPWDSVQFDLELHADIVDEEGSSVLAGASDVFDKTTLQRLARRYERVLDGFLEAGDRPLSELEYLGAIERHQALVEAETPGPESAELFALLSAPARRDPDAVALVHVDADGRRRTLSRGALLRLAEARAMRLAAAGAGPETIVGTALEHGVESVVAVLAILRAGAVWMPIDPQLGERGVSPDLLLDAHGCKPASSKSGTVRLPSSPAPEQAAYLLWTSGSSGRAKGVVVPRASLAAALAARPRIAREGASTRFLLLSPATFDSALTSLLGVHPAGGTLVTAASEIRARPERLGRLIAESRVECLNCVPSLWSMLLEEIPAQRLRGLRHVIVGGEVCDPELARRHLHRVPDARLCNEYGVTEGTISATFHLLPYRRKAENVPIGRAVPGARVYLVDPSLRPVPQGEIGEICQGGLLARGYFRDPAQTAERFVPDPWSRRRGERLYRTGDLGRRYADGRIEYLGRIDRQVQIHGVRVEPGEVEQALRDQSGVRDAAVLFHQGRLVAVCEIEAEKAKRTAGEDDLLRERLARRLPSAFVPTEIRFTGFLPRRSNGKLDHPQIEAQLLAERPAGVFVPPQTETEKALSEIWRKLLGCDEVGRDDDFFRLGGHSLLAVRLGARVERRFDVEMPLAELFRSSSLRDLAAFVEKKRRGLVDEELSPYLVEIRPGRRTLRRESPPLFLVHPVGGHVLCYRELARAIDLDRAIFGIQCREHRGDDAAPRDLATMAARYAETIRGMSPGPYCLAGWSMGGVIAYEIARQLHACGAEVEYLALIDVEAPARSVVPAIPEDVMPSDRLALFLQDLGVDETSLDSTSRSEEEMWRRVSEAVQDGGWAEIDPDAANLRNAYGRFRHNLRLLEEYDVGTFDGRVSLIRTIGDAADSTLGWSAYAEVEVSEIPGTHYSIVREPHVKELARRLQDSLNGVNGSVG